MNQYTSLAEYYDELTQDVPYQRFADRICGLLGKSRLPVQLLLELGCGTGTLSRILSQRGFEMICCDNSPEMLGIAMQKCGDAPVMPVFICQNMCRLDLYGTVQAAICCLDGINYLPDEKSLRRAVGRVSLFLEKGGLFIFDVKSKGMFRQMGGTASVYENDGLYGVWQYGYDEKSGLCQHTVDLFCKVQGGYRRLTETHRQRAFSRQQLEDVLTAAGFRVKGVYQDLSTKKAQAEEGRLLFVAEKR